MSIYKIPNEGSTLTGMLLKAPFLYLRGVCFFMTFENSLYNKKSDILNFFIIRVLLATFFILLYWWTWYASI